MAYNMPGQVHDLPYICKGGSLPLGRCMTSDLKPLGRCMTYPKCQGSIQVEGFNTLAISSNSTIQNTRHVLPKVGNLLNHCGTFPKGFVFEDFKSVFDVPIGS